MFNWKIVGIAVGTIGIALSVAFVVVFGYAFMFFGNDHLLLIVIHLLFALNLSCSIMWLFGIAKKRSGLMLASLFWWAVPFSAWIGFMCFLLYRGICTTNDSVFITHEENYKWLHSITLFFFGFYSAAVMSYISMKVSVQQDQSVAQSFEVTYSLATTLDETNEIKE